MSPNFLPRCEWIKSPDKREIKRSRSGVYENQSFSLSKMNKIFTPLSLFRFDRPKNYVSTTFHQYSMRGCFSLPCRNECGFSNWTDECLRFGVQIFNELRGFVDVGCSCFFWKDLDLNFATFQICFPSVKTEEKKIIVHLVDMRRNAFSASMVKFFFLAFLQPEYVSFCLIRY